VCNRGTITDSCAQRQWTAARKVYSGSSYSLGLTSKVCICWLSREQESCASSQNTARSEGSVSKWLDTKVILKFKSSAKVFGVENMNSSPTCTLRTYVLRAVKMVSNDGGKFGAKKMSSSYAARSDPSLNSVTVTKSLFSESRNSSLKFHFHHRRIFPKPNYYRKYGTCGQFPA